MVREMDEADFRDLMKEVHPAAESEVQDILSSLDEEWSSFIPEVLQDDSSFTRSGYRVGNTFVPNMLEVVIRVHKPVNAHALGMLTVKTREENGVIRVDSMYTMGPPDGFRNWSEIGGERKGNPVIIESRQVEYPEPSDGETHTDEQVKEVVRNVAEEVKNLTEKYDDITQEDIAQYYEE